jgi:hypothetical protein
MTDPSLANEIAARRSENRAKRRKPRRASQRAPRTLEKRARARPVRPESVLEGEASTPTIGAFARNSLKVLAAAPWPCSCLVARRHRRESLAT